ncbi:hypothetical protein AVEN_125729-1 [Araneus ventricosus]|uniref:Uncharacterized protein n=1 Tax=Araneus ventricosus TaxID=182803 RepID=A0A4Y2L9V6_ARAVE|nr:hypothetical protein AVEN_125729-1 [Araneus ventricosus]
MVNTLTFKALSRNHFASSPVSSGSARRNSRLQESTVCGAGETFHGKAPMLARTKTDRVATAILTQFRCSALTAPDPSPKGPVLRTNH